MRWMIAIIMAAALSSCTIYDRHMADKGGYNVDLTPDNNGEDWR